jgi:hypothetical protein
MTVSEFLERLIERHACSDGIKIAKECDTLQEMADKATGDMLSWVLARWPNLSEEVNVDWSEIAGDAWSYLLIRQTQFAEHCDWDVLRGRDWVWLLQHKPEFAEYCDWSTIDCYGWDSLIRWQPKLKKYRSSFIEKIGA